MPTTTCHPDARFPIPYNPEAVQFLSPATVPAASPDLPAWECEFYLNQGQQIVLVVRDTPKGPDVVHTVDVVALGQGRWGPDGIRSEWGTAIEQLLDQNGIRRPLA